MSVRVMITKLPKRIKVKLKMADAAFIALKKVLTQYNLIASLCVALKKLEKSNVWKDLFINVNLHPDYCVSFLEWMQWIEVHTTTGESEFVDCNNFMFDCMPAV